MNYKEETKTNPSSRNDELLDKSNPDASKLKAEETDLTAQLQAQFNVESASEKIDLQNIIELKEAFDAADLDKGGALELNEFITAFGSVLSASIMNQKQLVQLFMKIDANSDGGVEWDEFMNYILLENQSLNQMKEDQFDYIKSDIEDPSTEKDYAHNNMITDIVLVKGDKYHEETNMSKTMKYLTCGRDGCIKVFNANQEALSTIEVTKSYCNAITYMRLYDYVAVATQDYSLVFYDLNLSSTAIKTPVGKLSALQSPILSLWAFEFHDPKRQYLIAGDAAGVFTLFEFKKNWHICNDELSCHKDEIKNYQNSQLLHKMRTLKKNEDIKHKWKILVTSC